MEHGFRAYQETDYKEVLELVREELTAFGEKLDKSEVERVFKEDLSPERDFIQIMVDERGRLAGWYRYGPWTRQDEEEGRAVHLFDIALRKKFRGKGLGTTLYRHFEDSVMERGFKRVYSNSRQGNAGAATFHEAMGFSVASRKEHNILWVKGLQKEGA